jgi:ribosomal subunit interface protein
MKLPLQITFRHIDHSDSLEQDIREHADRLDSYYPDIISCRVVFDASHKHKNKGNLYQVNVDVKVPGGEIVASSKSSLHQAHEDAYVAIRDAFEALYKQLKQYAQKQHGDVKRHEVPNTGTVKALYPERDYGLIETFDGREIYFHRNSLLNGKFDSLDIGESVRFNEELGEKGVQASSVKVTSKIE